MGVDKSDWERKSLNALQREGFNMECDERR